MYKWIKLQLDHVSYLDTGTLNDTMSESYHTALRIWVNLQWVPGSGGCSANKATGTETDCDNKLVWTNIGNFVYDASYMPGVFDKIVVDEHIPDKVFVWYPNQALLMAVADDEMSHVICQDCTPSEYTYSVTHGYNQGISL